MRRLAIPLLSLGVLAAIGALAAAAHAEELPAGYAGSGVCRECHEDLFAHFERNVHAQPAAAARSRRGVGGCESCHGPGAQHAADPTAASSLVTFRDSNAGEASRACLSCHREDREVAQFLRAAHGRSDVSCTACHASPHAPAPLRLPRAGTLGRETAQVVGRHLKDDRDELCLGCHPELRGRLAMPYRHPVAEGALACVSCHDPHSAGATSLPARQRCFACHEDKRGPWAFEHAPVAEDCSACHDPHGSVAPGLLRAAEPFLCLACHALPDDRHGEEIGGTQFSRAIYQRCTTCHGAIHGSHGDRHLKK